MSMQPPSPNDFQSFCGGFEFQRKLNSGSDGTVSCWRNKSTGQAVAVKTAHPGNSKALIQEVQALQKVPAHPHIVSCLNIIQDGVPEGPVIVLELAAWGDMHDYRRKLVRQLARVPEMTLWAFLRDMSLALDWLHNHSGSEPLIHGDLKPENVLVFSPPGWHSQDVPRLPVFKICDIARLEPLSAQAPFCGTWEYAPPFAERQVVQTPAVDIWSVGGSTQWFALGVDPVISRAEFLQTRREAGEYVPSLAELDSSAWRAMLRPQYRPLDASIDFQVDKMKLSRPVSPYSHEFNSWYEKLMEVQVKKRITSKALVKRFVPLANVNIETLVSKDQYEVGRQTGSGTNAQL